MEKTYEEEIAELDAQIAAVEKLSRDMKKAACQMGDGTARYMVDAFYREQQERIAADAMVRQAEKVGEPIDTVKFIAEQHRRNEASIKSMLDSYTSNNKLGAWAKSICGIGPVIAAGLLAHIDITKTQTAGGLQRFAGLDPTIDWCKGQKRPYNAKLKTLVAFKLGESFVKTQNRDNDIYGHLFAEHKAMEQAKNEAGGFAEEARAILAKKKIGKNTEAYKWYSQGKLPPAHIHARARRYAVKIFLSHFFEVAYEIKYGKRPPEPYSIAILNHAHKIEVPNWTHVA